MAEQTTTFSRRYSQKACFLPGSTNNFGTTIKREEDARADHRQRIVLMREAENEDRNWICPLDLLRAGPPPLACIRPIFDPALPTMRQPKAEIGRLAALELLRQMNDAEFPERPSRIGLSCDLIIRNSTKALRSGATSQTPVSSATRKSRLLTRSDIAAI